MTILLMILMIFTTKMHRPIDLLQDSRDLQDAFKDQSMGEELGLSSVPENYTPDSFDEISYEKRKELKNLLMT